MRKLGKVLVGFSVLLMISACSNGKLGNNKKAASSNRIVSLKVNGASYIKPEDEKADKDEAFLAVDVEIKNKSKKTLNYDQSSFALYDKNDEKVALTSTSINDDSFSMIKKDHLNAGKKTHGYLIYEVKKNEKYELHFEPANREKDKEKDLVLKINTTQYKDELDNSKEAVKAFIDTIFMGKENKNYEKLVANNKETEDKAFYKFYIDKFGTEEMTYKPTDAEYKKVFQLVRNKFAQDSEIKYEIESCYPLKATILVRPTSLDDDSMMDETSKIAEKFLDQTDKDYNSKEDLYRDMQKYLVEHYEEIFKNTKMSESPSYDEGYVVTLTRKKVGDKWKIDADYHTEKPDFVFAPLARLFAGSTY